MVSRATAGMKKCLSVPALAQEDGVCRPPTPPLELLRRPPPRPAAASGGPRTDDLLAATASLTHPQPTHEAAAAAPDAEARGVPPRAAKAAAPARGSLGLRLAAAAAVVALAALAQALAPALAPGADPAALPMECQLAAPAGAVALDAGRLAGAWWEAARVPLPGTGGGACGSVNITAGAGNTLALRGSGDDGVPSPAAAASLLAGGATLAVATGRGTAVPLRVLATDYDTYAVVASCAAVLPAGSHHSVALLSRGRQPLGPVAKGEALEALAGAPREWSDALAAPRNVCTAWW